MSMTKCIMFSRSVSKLGCANCKDHPRTDKKWLKSRLVMILRTFLFWEFWTNNCWP